MSKKKHPKRSGLLREKITQFENNPNEELARGLAGLNDPDRATQKRVDLEFEKLLLLLDEYGIDRENPDSWLLLAWELAAEYEPGFQIRKKDGRRKKWTKNILDILKVEVDLEKEKTSQEGGVGVAIQRIAAREPWRSFVESHIIPGLDDDDSDPSLALEKAYYSANRAGGLWAARYERWESQGTLNYWEAAREIEIEKVLKKSN